MICGRLAAVAPFYFYPSPDFRNMPGLSSLDSLNLWTVSCFLWARNLSSIFNRYYKASPSFRLQSAKYNPSLFGLALPPKESLLPPSVLSTLRIAPRDFDKLPPGAHSLGRFVRATIISWAGPKSESEARGILLCFKLCSFILCC